MENARCTLLAYMCGAYAILLGLSVVGCMSCVSVSTITTRNKRYIKCTQYSLIQMFIMFLDCASLVLVVPPTLTIKLWLKNHIFIFSTSSLKPSADGISYYARRFPKPSPS